MDRGPYPSGQVRGNILWACFRNQPLDPSDVNGLGILLGDKKAGPFELEIDWIKVDRTS